MIRQLLCVLTFCLSSPAWAEVPAAARDARSRGWLRDDPDRYRLTESGFHFADRVAADLMNAV